MASTFRCISVHDSNVDHLRHRACSVTIIVASSRRSRRRFVVSKAAGLMIEASCPPHFDRTLIFASATLTAFEKNAQLGVGVGFIPRKHEQLLSHRIPISKTHTPKPQANALTGTVTRPRATGYLHRSTLPSCDETSFCFFFNV